MLIKNCPREAIERAARLNGVRVAGISPAAGYRNAWRVRLARSQDEYGRRYRKVNPRTGGNSPGLNWYGFRDFFNRLFWFNPQAVVETGGPSLAGKVVYRGLSDFIAKFDDTGDVPVCSHYTAKDFAPLEDDSYAATRGAEFACRFSTEGRDLLAACHVTTH